ncbi:hypothetical protein HPB51_010469 [Rhipicephalus microplus]|uniref:Uncharacterized protein n=1 Tax=Rhipicephalus microplus TaxID=6941 RepID=A0A9J6DZV3_RHIMP|nr:hypothetical protein HPB51_010469 [Rhipicephalus microplus]
MSDIVVSPVPSEPEGQTYISWVSLSELHGFPTCAIREDIEAVPPNYPVERIEVPVALFSSVGDTVADSDDVSDLAQALYGTLFFHNVVPPTNFRHLDFVLGHQATDFLHENMLAAIDKKVPRT